MTEQSEQQDLDDLSKPDEAVDFPPPNHRPAYYCFGVVFVAVNLAIVGCALRLIQVETTGLDGQVHAKLSAPTQSAITEALMQASAEMKRKLKPSVDPCVDFYDFACGGWHDLDEVENSEEELSFLATLQYMTDKQILDILNKPIAKRDMFYSIQPRRFFAACMDKAKLKKLGSSPFLEFIKSIGKFPILDPSWKESDFDLQDMVTRLGQLGFPVLFKFTVEKHGLFAILTPDTYTLSQNGRAYFNWTSVTLAHLRSDAKVEDNLNDFQQMFEVEAAIYEVKRNIQRAHGNTPHDKMNILKISELQQRVPWLNWLKFLNNLDLGLSPYRSRPLSADEDIIVGNPLFLAQIYNDVLARFPKRAVANFLMKSLLVFTAALDFRYMSLPAYIEAKAGKPRLDRTKRCLLETKQMFPELISRMYVEEFYEHAITYVVKGMFRNIKNAYLDSLDRTMWLNESSKIKSKTKVAAMDGHIGYSECLEKLQFLDSLYRKVPTGDYFAAVKGLILLKTSRLISRYRSDRPVEECWHRNQAFDVGAFYDLVSNYVELAAANLQPPVYSPRWPLSMQYSRVGFLLAHFIMHSLDSIGHLHDEFGFKEKWFTRDDLVVFNGKMRCLIAQYNGYTFQGENINGAVTMDDNLCDYQGLRESYKAYKQELNRTMSKDLLLPGITLTPDQVFFTSYAQMLCQQIPKEMVEDAVMRSQAPNKLRVIGTLQNSYEFAEAFGCKLNNPMHPSNKCDMLS